MTSRIRISLAAVRPRRPAGLQRLLVWLRDAMDRARQRRRLAELDDRLLRDIGLTRADVREETRKPSWRGVPRP